MAVDTTETLRAWLATNPPTDAKQETFAQLVESLGFDRARHLWLTGLGFGGTR